LSEVMLRGTLDSIVAVSERYDVQIAFEDLLLGVMLLHLASCLLLATLALEPGECGFIAVVPVDDVRMHVADQLLRDGDRATPVAHDVVLYRAGDADEIDAVVLIEALILDRDERLAYVFGERANRNAR